MCLYKCECTFFLWVFQHESGRVAYWDAQKQLDEIHKRIVTLTSSIEDTKTKLDKNKLESSKARKLEEVCDCSMNSVHFYVCLLACFYIYYSCHQVSLHDDGDLALPRRKSESCFLIKYIELLYVCQMHILKYIERIYFVFRTLKE